MLAWAFIFMTGALIAGLFGFSGERSSSQGVARVLFFVFLVMFAVVLTTGYGRAILR